MQVPYSFGLTIVHCLDYLKTRKLGRYFWKRGEWNYYTGSHQQRLINFQIICRTVRLSISTSMIVTDNWGGNLQGWWQNAVQFGCSGGPSKVLQTRGDDQ